MATYVNGRIPAGVLRRIASGYDRNGYWEFQTTEATYARWRRAKQYALTKFGRTLFIRTGWNIYRPYAVQQEARQRACAQGNCAAAASPGYSSHGGSWGGRDCLAIDVDPNGLTWAQVWEACRSAGFSAGLITKAIAGIDEPWHIIDFNAFGAAPAWDAAEDFEEDDSPDYKEDDMAYPFLVGKHKYLLSPGQIKHFPSDQPIGNGAKSADGVNRGPATLTRDIVSAADSWVAVDVPNFLAQLDAFGIPRSVWDQKTGYISPHNDGKYAAGGMWSWARSAYNVGQASLEAIRQLASASGTPVNVEAIARAVNDEQDRRERERLGS